MTPTSLFLPFDGLMSGLISGLTSSPTLHSSRFAASSISPDECADCCESGDVGRQGRPRVKNGDNRQKIFRIHSVVFRWLGGMDARGGGATSPRNPQVAMRLRSLVSRKRASGGSPAQIRGQRSPQQGRKPISGAETWSNVEGRRCAVSYEPSRNELGA